LPGILNDGALVYVESEEAVAPESETQFETLRKDRAGAVHYALLRFAAMRK
jgi:hypothetical protein